MKVQTKMYRRSSVRAGSNREVLDGSPHEMNLLNPGTVLYSKVVVPDVVR